MPRPSKKDASLREAQRRVAAILDPDRVARDQRIAAATVAAIDAAAAKAEAEAAVKDADDRIGEAVAALTAEDVRPEQIAELTGVPAVDVQRLTRPRRAPKDTEPGE